MSSQRYFIYILVYLVSGSIFFLIQRSEYEKKNGSLFTYLTATVTVNGLENEMSSELRFQGRKWGVASRVHPRDPPKGGREGLPLLKTPHF